MLSMNFTMVRSSMSGGITHQLPHVRESIKTVMDSGFHAVGFLIPGTWFQSLSVELWFWIPIFSRIPDSLSCIPDSKAQDFGSHKPNLFRIPIPQAKILQIQESGFLFMGRHQSGFAGLTEWPKRFRWRVITHLVFKRFLITKKKAKIYQLENVHFTVFQTRKVLRPSPPT